MSCLNNAAGLKFGGFGELEPAVPPYEMARPSDVAPEVLEMPTCKPVLNGEPLTTLAICWSIVGMPVALPLTCAPLSAAEGMLACGAASLILIAQPVTTDNQGFTSCRGASCSLSCQASPVPVVFGTQRTGMMPLPKNHEPKRSGRAPPAAYAVPLLLSIPKRRGSGTATLMPPAITPRRNMRRGRMLRLLLAILISL